MTTALLGIIEFEKDPLQFSQLKALTFSWLQDAGGFAAIALLVLIISQAAARDNSRLVRFTPLMKILTGLAFAIYAVYLGINAFGTNARTMTQMLLDGVDRNSATYNYFSQEGLARMRGWLLVVAGALSIVAFLIPFLSDMIRMRWGRIYAIAKLSFKEAVRRRIIWVFLIFLLIFFFPAKWFFQIKQENELRSQIDIIYSAEAYLLLFTALLLASFSIPGDIKNQTIHTIVTKPVERFEILLGRYLGYVGLLTAALFFLTGISLLFISLSNVDPAAVDESMRSRLPKYGRLQFASKKSDFAGIDVGREKVYRKYIAGGEGSSHRGIFLYTDISNLSGQYAVPCEFAFDIYRLTKGEENKGVRTSFNFLAWNHDPLKDEAYIAAMREAFGGYPVNVQPPDARLKDERERTKRDADWKKVGEIAKQFGRYEYRGFPLYDYHTWTIQVPPGFFEGAAQGNAPEQSGTFPDGTPWKDAPVRAQVQVKCDSISQMLGMAGYDLYFLEAEGSFIVNFFKGALGLWCRLCLVIGVAIVCSTYLSGVVSFLIALFLFIMGFFQDFLQSLAYGQNVGGGPLESFARLVRGDVAAAQIDKTPLVTVYLYMDEGFRWIMRRLLNVIPDVDRFDWTKYVAEGFSIRPELIVMNTLFMVAYLLPWFLVGYYLLKTREVAA